MRKSMLAALAGFLLSLSGVGAGAAVQDQSLAKANVGGYRFNWCKVWVGQCGKAAADWATASGTTCDQPFVRVSAIFPA